LSADPVCHGRSVGGAARVWVLAGRVGEQDTLTVCFECAGGDRAAFGVGVAEVLKLRGRVDIVAPGSLPDNGLVIDDRRKYD